MYPPSFLPPIASILAIAVGLGVYELLVRRFLPPSAGMLDDRLAGGRQWGSAGKAVLVSVSRRLDTLVPLSRLDSSERRELLDKVGVRLEPETWRGVRVLCLAGCLVVAVALGLLVSIPFQFLLLVVAASATIGWAMPLGILAFRTKRRRDEIDAQLPDAMELIGIAVAAGSPVEQCFREVAASLERPLSDELLLVDREVNLFGRSREEAFEKLARRCGSQDVSAFVAHLIQSINQGSSIAEGLVSQATLAREVAHMAVLERIRKMPTKLDIVLSFCFLPPTVILVIAPIIVNLTSFLNETFR